MVYFHFVLHECVLACMSRVLEQQSQFALHVRYEVTDLARTGGLGVAITSCTCEGLGRLIQLNPPT